jgi:CHASE2 domain-containing sensor protein
MQISLQTRLQTFVSSFLFRYENVAGITLAIIATFVAGYHFLDALSDQSTGTASQDWILQNRLSSPVPSSSIVILDIDERSLAILAAQHGRWPWSREVLAEGLERILADEPEGVIFNVLISDPDLKNPDGDALLDYVASSSSKAVFPMIRLDPQNDAQSQLKIATLPGTRPGANAEAGRTIAAVLPGLPGMQTRLGLANNDPDGDGIVRRYRFDPTVDGWSIPSLVSATLNVTGRDVAAIPESYWINWRNKQGVYQRISYSDFYQAKKGKISLRGKYVIIGASAPGIAQVVPTAVEQLQDSNEIIATALDDALNKTWLRTNPAWFDLVLSILAAWGLVWARAAGIRDELIDRIFFLTQTALGGVCLLLVSYANILFDASAPMGILAGVFSAILISNSLGKRWGSAYLGYREQIDKAATDFVVVGLHAVSGPDTAKYDATKRTLLALFGWRYVIRLEDVVDKRSIVGDSLAAITFFCAPATAEIRAQLAQLATPDNDKLVVAVGFSSPTGWAPSDRRFRSEVTQRVLEVSRRLLEKNES